MKYRIEENQEFSVMGIKKEISQESAYAEIPAFWQETWKRTDLPLHLLGEFGICMDDEKLQYMIAGRYHGGTVPEGWEIITFPKMTWAKFTCIGPMPKALQEVNTQIFQHWLKENKKYRMSKNWNIEWYSDGDNQSDTYISEIWIPVEEI